MASEHTQGPWRSERVVMSKYGVDAYFEVKGGPTGDESVGVFARDICQTIMREIGSEDALLAEDEANARLIAAAPELLKALRQIYVQAESWHTMHGHERDAVRCDGICELIPTMKAAIRKAEWEGGDV